jgi:hypothetical protein
MRLIELTNEHWVKRGLNGTHKVYDNIQEAITDGIPEQEIVKDWRSIRDNQELIDRIVNNTKPVWILTTDKFVPDFTDDKNKRIVPLYKDGKIVPTDGCVIRVLEYRPSKQKGSRYIRICTGTFAFSNREITTEDRKYKLRFARFYYMWGDPNRITNKKREAAFALLSPMSPTHGRMLASFNKFFPHYLRMHRVFVARILARQFYNEPWFFKLIRKDWVMSMLVKDLQGELRKNNMDENFIATKMKLAVDMAEKNEDPKALVAILKEIRDILQKETNPRIPPNPLHELPSARQQFELPPTPVIDNNNADKVQVGVVQVDIMDNVGGDTIPEDPDLVIQEAKIIEETIGE